MVMIVPITLARGTERERERERQEVGEWPREKKGLLLFLLLLPLSASFFLLQNFYAEIL